MDCDTAMCVCVSKACIYQLTQGIGKAGIQVLAPATHRLHLHHSHIFDNPHDTSSYMSTGAWISVRHCR